MGVGGLWGGVGGILRVVEMLWWWPGGVAAAVCDPVLIPIHSMLLLWWSGWLIPPISSG